MSETKHTPGPWRAEEDRRVVTDFLFRILSPSGECVAIADTSTIRARGYEDLRADAVLLAAAPDLLTACRFALSTFNHAGWRDSYAAGQLRAVIAKAEGQQK